MAFCNPFRLFFLCCHLFLYLLSTINNGSSSEQKQNSAPGKGFQFRSFQMALPSTCCLLTISTGATSPASRVRFTPCSRRGGGSVFSFPRSSPSCTFFSVQSPNQKFLTSSVATEKSSTVGEESSDPSIDAVQRRLMFEDELSICCIFFFIFYVFLLICCVFLGSFGREL